MNSPIPDAHILYTIDTLSTLDGILFKYHQFADVFSKQRSKTLPKHHPYNLAIQLKEETLPLLGTIYSLSKLELETLWEFIEENTRTGII